MSVVVQNPDYGWVVEPCALLDRALVRCVGRDREELRCSFRPGCFDALTRPYGAVSLRSDVTSLKDKSPVKPSRVRSFILEGTKSLVEAARPLGYLKVPEVPEDGPRGEPLPWPDCNLAALCDMAKQLPLVEEFHHVGVDDGDEEEEEVEALVQYLPSEGVGGISHIDLFSKMTESAADSAVAVTLMGADYVIPPRSCFLLSDFTRIRPLVHYGKKFDLIVLDPPWENKSVKRSGRYSSLPSSQLHQLPVPLLAAPGCLVVTWVTNKPRLLRFVRDQLYPRWGVRVVAEWFWVKVTTAGEFVFPLDSPHKKPYETPTTVDLRSRPSKNFPRTSIAWWSASRRSSTPRSPRSPVGD
ncbi:hypothetical protein NHX12_021613 [Muraenolepis orangiensis]|uniref:Methyltransferase like 4 n=1 Tax=Muraenolepis orangiensis TaxID=630683 RepID=A0A9Q0EU11_9TELE|nr:hypothetical protein NHX12_021613 [Muraenolepis orangiensis]